MGLCPPPKSLRIGSFPLAPPLPSIPLPRTPCVRRNLQPPTPNAGLAPSPLKGDPHPRLICCSIQGHPT
ncbi:hypothetical protein E2320_000823 [Naja naja]|nr:hypothetical protein E2320_000823 [Naja naja]